MTDEFKIVFNFDRSAEAELANRAERMMPRGPPMDVGEINRSVQFLRGVFSRSTFALTGFYLLLAADRDGKNLCTVSGYSGQVLQSHLHFSSLNTIALACRKVFDHGKGLTGAGFGRQREATLERHAEYWARNSERPMEDAFRALHFLRTFFAKCSKTDANLFKEGTTLGRRIGLVKQYADGAAAHLSLQDYEFDQLDLAHLVAAMALVGEIIRSFDMPHVAPGYFNELDEAAFNAAVALFPDAPKMQLFERMKVEQQARICWQWGEDNGIQMLTEQLPYAISWF